jgi:competence protein ComFC
MRLVSRASVDKSVIHCYYIDMLRNFMGGIINIIWPQTCVVCKNKIDSGKFVCSGCWQEIKRNMPPFCHHCGRHLENRSFAKNICNSCLKKRFHFDRAFSPFKYEGTVKELIQAFKYKGYDHLGPLLSGLMVDFAKEYSVPVDFVDFIIPVPLHRAKLREREFNQAEILGNYIAGAFAKRALNNNLLRHRLTKTQTGLGNEERASNVKNSFSVKEKETIKGKNILLVDDVLTTAATCSEAAGALKNSGANIVFVLTLAS